jgi:hypothetical protein
MAVLARLIVEEAAPRRPARARQNGGSANWGVARGYACDPPFLLKRRLGNALFRGVNIGSPFLTPMSLVPKE